MRESTPIHTPSEGCAELTCLVPQRSVKTTWVRDAGTVQGDVAGPWGLKIPEEIS